MKLFKLNFCHTFFKSTIKYFCHTFFKSIIYMSYVNQHLGYNTSSGLNDICGMNQYKKQASPVTLNSAEEYDNKKMIEETLNKMNDDIQYVPVTDSQLDIIEESDDDNEPEPPAPLEDPEDPEELMDILKSKYSVEAQKLNKKVNRNLPKQKKGKKIIYTDTI